MVLLQQDEEDGQQAGRKGDMVGDRTRGSNDGKSYEEMGAELRV